MTTLRTMRGLTTEEYAELQQEVKRLPFSVTVRIHREHYCSGAVDIRPTKKMGYRFSTEQVEILRSLAATLRLDDGMQSISKHNEWDPCCFWQGMKYLQKSEQTA